MELFTLMYVKQHHWVRVSYAVTHCIRWSKTLATLATIRVEESPGHMVCKIMPQLHAFLCASYALRLIQMHSESLQTKYFAPMFYLRVRRGNKGTAPAYAPDRTAFQQSLPEHLDSLASLHSLVKTLDWTVRKTYTNQPEQIISMLPLVIGLSAMNPSNQLTGVHFFRAYYSKQLSQCGGPCFFSLCKHQQVR